MTFEKLDLEKSKLMVINTITSRVNKGELVAMALFFGKKDPNR